MYYQHIDYILVPHSGSRFDYIPPSLRDKRVRDAAEEQLDASMGELATTVPSATAELAKQRMSSGSMSQVLTTIWETASLPSCCRLEQWS